MGDNKKKGWNKFLLLNIFLTFLTVNSVIIILADTLVPPLPNYNYLIPEKNNLATDNSLDIRLYTGSAIFDYPIEIPPGTNRLI